MHLGSGWAGNADGLRWAASQLAGLGSGLTPAGDDFLVGVMLWAWLLHPDLTKDIPFGPAMNDLLEEFRAAHTREAQLAGEALDATSGADALAGFLWAADRAAL